MAGQLSKFNPEVKKKLLYAIRKGAPYQHACNYAKISFEIFRQWRKKARNGEEQFVAFFEQLKEAESETALIWLDKIDKAMNEGAWQAAAWKLERRYPEVYSINAALIKRADKLAKLIEGKEKINAKELDSRSDQERCIAQTVEGS